MTDIQLHEHYRDRASSALRIWEEDMELCPRDVRPFWHIEIGRLERLVEYHETKLVELRVVETVREMA
jgi:hypothetical protein